MKKISAHMIFGIAIILALMATGCIAPPKGTTPAPVSSNNLVRASVSGTNNSTPVPTTQSYVTEATPFETTVLPIPAQVHALPSVTQNPEDIVCLISFTTHTYSYNKTAFTFNLTNPPMYINYTIINPRILTGTKTIPMHSSENVDTVPFSYFDPTSWFEITVRNKTTGAILLQEGFMNGHEEYTNRTIKVFNKGDLLVEMEGNRDVTAAVGIWVKPEGNLKSSFDTNTTECVNFIYGMEVANR
jgi:hypothetical protein